MSNVLHGSIMVNYLTEEAKRIELSGWDSSRRVYSHNPSFGMYHSGNPDADMVEWCDKLNRLYGVCTLQSCAGHIQKEYRTCGHVWLWLDAASAHAFHVLAHDLARSELIERLSQRYWATRSGVFEIEFKGNESGLLQPSLDLLYGFVETCSRS